MTTHTLSALRQLKLPGMAAALQTQLEQLGTYEELAFTERLALLLEQELLSREQHKHQRLIRQARLQARRLRPGHRLSAPPQPHQDPDRTPRPGRMDRTRAEPPAHRSLRQRQDLHRLRPRHSACLRGYTVRYHRLSRLLLELHQAKADGSYHKRLMQLVKVRLLIIDDWGLETLTPAQRNELMEIMDDRHGLTSTVMVSQLPTDQWYASIGDNTLADAILDRLMHNAHRLQLKGESMRKIMGQLTDDEHLG